MTDQTYTHLLIVADRSGSMRVIREDMNAGLASFLDEQAKLDGKLLVDLITFDNEWDLVNSNAKVSDIQHPIIYPRGRTALLDALGNGIAGLGEKLSKLPEEERPGTVIVMVVTDGHENASVEYTGEVIKKLVETQQNEFAWKFLFLGANIDSFAVAGDLGFTKGSTINYAPTKDGTQSVLRSASAFASTVRGGQDYSFTDADRDASMANVSQP